MEKDIKLLSIKKRLGNLLIAFIMLISFAQALLITELITGRVRVSSYVPARAKFRPKSGTSETEEMVLRHTP